MHVAAALSCPSSARRIASIPPRPRLSCDSMPLLEGVSCGSPTPLLLARARAAHEHPTISFRPVVRSVCPQNHCKSLLSNHRAGRSVLPVVCLRGATNRPYASYGRLKVPDASGHRTTVRGSHQPFHLRRAQCAPAAATQRWTPIKHPSARRSSSCSPTLVCLPTNDRPAVTCTSFGCS